MSRADIAKALSKSDQFDFLIDIVPRDEPFPHSGSKKSGASNSNAAHGAGNAGGSGAQSNALAKRDQVRAELMTSVYTLTPYRRMALAITWGLG